MRAVLLVLALASLTARANDHRGSLGLIVATGGEYVTGISNNGSSDRGFRIPIELGGTLGVFNRSELILAARIAPGFAPTFGTAVSFYGGIRNGWAFGDWRTFFDLELAVHAYPVITVGARVAFGVQYDFHPLVGVYGQIGAQIGGGQGLRLSFEGVVGVQFRTYLFD